MNTELEKNGTSIDPTPYIRTYAKDFAALSGKEAPDMQKGSIQHTPKAASKKHELLEQQSYENPTATLVVPNSDTNIRPSDLSSLQNDAENISEQQLADITPPSDGSEKIESINLPKIDTGDIVPAKSRFTFSEKESPAENDFAHAYKTPLTTFGQAPSTIPSDTERDAILARLKARIASESAPAFAPQPIIQQENNVAPVAEAAFIPEPLPPTPMVAIPEPSPFHSFSTDFAQRIDDKGASQFSVLAAEKDAAPRMQVQTKPRKNFPILPIVAAIALICIGTGGLYVAYKYMTSTAAVAILAPAPTLVSSNAEVTLSGSGVPLQESLAQLSTKTIAANSITVALLGSSDETASSSAPTSLFSALQLPAPDILLRNIDPLTTVGVINDGQQTAPFFVLRVSSYARTFAGMLAWEPTMPQDLGVFYTLYPAQEIPASTTSTSTSPIPTYSDQPQSTGQFVDEVVDNHNARALKDTAGNTIMIYGYSDQQTLIIARDEAAFTQIIGRLTSTT
jgi:hypothetical protein